LLVLGKIFTFLKHVAIFIAVCTLYTCKKGLGMVNSLNSQPNNVAGFGIYCNNVDISKLSKEERDKYLDKMPNVTMSGMGPCYPAGYYMNNYGGQTVKKRIIRLTDDYIKGLEQQLNDEDPEMREYAASEIIKRLEEDKTRYNDKAMNALVNKMVLDPFSHKVRGRGLMALENNMVSGDENTRQILQWIQEDPNLLDRDRTSIQKIMLQLDADTTLVNAPVTTGGTVVE